MSSDRTRRTADETATEPQDAAKAAKPGRAGVPVYIAYAADKSRIGKVEYHDPADARQLVAEGRARYLDTPGA